MQYVCTECGKVFDEEEIRYEEEYRGEYWGVPAYETESYSPCCNEPIDEFIPCCEYCQYFSSTIKMDGEHYCMFKEEETEKSDVCKDFELADRLEY